MTRATSKRQTATRATSRRGERSRLRLVAGADFHGPRSQCPPRRKRGRRSDRRTALLQTLRQQRQQISGWSSFERSDAPELFDLAMTAESVAPGRHTFIFRGVRFYLKFGFRLYVCDPTTGDILVGGRVSI